MKASTTLFILKYTYLERIMWQPMVFFSWLIEHDTFLLLNPELLGSKSDIPRACRLPISDFTEHTDISDIHTSDHRGPHCFGHALISNELWAALQNAGNRDRQ
jgi:hypothetical protein